MRTAALHRRYGKARVSGRKRQLALDIARTISNDRWRGEIDRKHMAPGPLKEAVERGGVTYRAGLLRAMKELTGLDEHDPEVRRIIENVPVGPLPQFPRSRP